MRYARIDKKTGQILNLDEIDPKSDGGKRFMAAHPECDFLELDDTCSKQGIPLQIGDVRTEKGAFIRSEVKK